MQNLSEVFALLLQRTILIRQLQVVVVHLRHKHIISRTFSCDCNYQIQKPEQCELSIRKRQMHELFIWNDGVSARSTNLIWLQINVLLRKYILRTTWEFLSYVYAQRVNLLIDNNSPRNDSVFTTATNALN